MSISTIISYRLLRYTEFLVLFSFENLKFRIISSIRRSTYRIAFSKQSKMLNPKLSISITSSTLLCVYNNSSLVQCMGLIYIPLCILPHRIIIKETFGEAVKY